MCPWNTQLKTGYFPGTFYQILQNGLGKFLISVLGASKKEDYYVSEKLSAGITLGEYIIVPTGTVSVTICHERGHREQSRRLGFKYLFKVGIPSLVFNVYSRLFHKKWTKIRRQQWYYSLPWEKEADDLGGVKRDWN